jgi:predicted signal transduction protein with EAL and GGDEF domain
VGKRGIAGAEVIDRDPHAEGLDRREATRGLVDVARGVDASGTRALSVRCVSAVETAVARAGYSKCGVSATVGYALFPYHGITLDTLVDAADSALMDAKIKGKRQVSCAINGSAVKTASQ